MTFEVHFAYAPTDTQSSQQLSACLAYYGATAASGNGTCATVSRTLDECGYPVTYTITTPQAPGPTVTGGSPLVDAAYRDTSTTSLVGSVPKLENFGASCPGQPGGECWAFANYPTQLQAAAVPPAPTTKSTSPTVTIGGVTTYIEIQIQLTLDGYQWCPGTISGGACIPGDPTSIQGVAPVCSTAQNNLIPSANNDLFPGGTCLLTFTQRGSWPLEARAEYSAFGAVYLVTNGSEQLLDAGPDNPLVLSPAGGDPLMGPWSSPQTAYVGAIEATLCQPGISC